MEQMNKTPTLLGPVYRKKIIYIWYQYSYFAEVKLRYKESPICTRQSKDSVPSHLPWSPLGLCQVTSKPLPTMSRKKSLSILTPESTFSQHFYPDLLCLPVVSEAHTHIRKAQHSRLVTSKQYSPRNSRCGHESSQGETVEPSSPWHMETKDRSETQHK